uniref:Sodium-coupled monocarboxylate transporter 2 n=1 Tax=Magallana gigas TaxID=29159 RepID=K1PVA8_MAGGI
MGLTVFLAGSMGLVSYAYFVKVRCDPLASKFIKNPNQIIPILVTEIFQEMPGMTGLFIAGLLCASLREGFNQIYGMSFQWFDFIAIILVFVVGLITSKIVGAPREEDVDARYVLCFTEQFFPYLPKKRRKQIKVEDRRYNVEMVGGTTVLEEEKGYNKNFREDN